MVLADLALDERRGLRHAQGMDHSEIVDLEPHGSPPPISVARRAACFLFGALLAFAAFLLFTTPKFWGLGFVMAMMLTGGSLALLGTALFPKLTFHKLDRRRWR